MLLSFKNFSRAVAVFVLAMGVAFVGLSSVAGASIIDGQPRYCKDANTKKCLQPIQVTITDNCKREGGVINFTFVNPNSVDAPRSIAVFFNGTEIFGDDGFAEPGTTTFSYGPFENGEWRVVVSYQDRVFADRIIQFSCR